MCCLGFLARQCGYKAKDITGLKAPHQLTDAYLGVDKWPRGLVNKKSHVTTVTGYKLMDRNDCDNLSDKKREAAIRKLFKKLKVTVQFVGQY